MTAERKPVLPQAEVRAVFEQAEREAQSGFWAERALRAKAPALKSEAPRPASSGLSKPLQFLSDAELQRRKAEVFGPLDRPADERRA